MSVIYLCPTLPYGQCKWEGESSEVLGHIEDCHRKVLSFGNVLEIKFAEQKDENLFMHYLREVYLVQSRVYLNEMGKRKLKLVMRYLGSAIKAKKLRYSVQVTCGNFTFDKKNSSLVKINDEGSVEIDVEGILLYANFNLKSLSCTFNFEEETDPKEEPDPIEKSIYHDEDIENLFDQNNDSLMLLEAYNPFAQLLLKRFNDGADQVDSIKNTKETKTIQKPRRNTWSSESFGLRRIFNEDKEIEKNRNSENTKEPEEKRNLILSMSNQQLKLLSCRMCKVVMTPPIFVCPFGHSVCGNCRSEKCSFCFGKVNLRNLDLEERSKNLFHKCTYSALCGTNRLTIDELRKHEISCKYMVYCCPLDGEKGNFDELESHMKIRHCSITIKRSLINDVMRDEQFMIFNAFGVFYFKSFLSNSFVVWNLIFCGTIPMFYRCDISFKTKKENIKYDLIKTSNEYSAKIPYSEMKSKKLKKGVLSIYTN